MDSSPPSPAPLRTGFTTGANACAAACAAATLLRQGRLPPWQGPLPAATADLYDRVDGSIEIQLPDEQRVAFPVRVAELREGEAYASVIKDAGDDPDCTHRAELWARVRPREDGDVQLLGGEGVGTVTRPGLGLPIGGPAINPVPRVNISANVRRILPRGATVVLGIRDGEERAKKTLNARLGIVGGLSILGTTGIVHPYSTAAFRASVAQGVEVAAAAGSDEVVLTTGGRSERFAMELLPHLPEAAFVQMGDFVGFALDQANRLGLRRATICGMVGKLAKMADGRTMTHAAGSEVDTALLADIARSVGAGEDLCARIAAANTARHVQELVHEEGFDTFFSALCERVALVLGAHLASRHARPLELHVVLCDFTGPALGRYPRD